MQKTSDADKRGAIVCGICPHLSKTIVKENGGMCAYGCNGTLKGMTPYVKNVNELNECGCQLMRQQITLFDYMRED